VVVLEFVAVLELDTDDALDAVEAVDTDEALVTVEAVDTVLVFFVEVVDTVLVFFVEVGAEGADEVTVVPPITLA
jgi:hypothetical protein